MTTLAIAVIILTISSPVLFALAWAIYVYRAQRKVAKKLLVKDYPFKNMFQNFSIIEAEINACETESDIDRARTSIIAFEGMYSDSGSFVSELTEMLESKTEEIFNRELIENMIGI